MEALKLLAWFLKAALRSELARQGHDVSGRLSQSVDVAVKETVNGFEIVGSAVFYAKYVEQGRKVGAIGIPMDVLVSWIRAKKLEIPGMKIQSQAFMFQRSIKAKGIRPSLFITQTLQDEGETIDRRIHEAVSGVLDAYIETMFNEINQKI